MTESLGAVVKAYPQARLVAFADLSSRERWIIAPAIALMFVLGIYPQLLIGLFNATVVQWVGNLKTF